MNNDLITFEVNGLVLSGFDTVDITRGVEECPSSFIFKTTDKYASLNQKIFEPMDSYIIKIGGDTVLTGYVDDITIDIDKEKHDFIFYGRSKCGLVVDSAAFIGPNGQTINPDSNPNINDTTIMNSTIFDVAKALLPAGIQLKSGVTPNKIYNIPFFIVNLGETIWDVLYQLAGFNALLIYDDVDGNLVLSQIGTNKHSSGLTVDNCQIYRADFNYAPRFSHYYGSYFSIDPNADVDGSPLIGVYQDKDVKIFKPTVVVSPQMAYDPLNGGITQSVALLVAQWECKRRIGRSQILNVRVDSWRDSSGLLWQPNYLINVDLPQSHIANQLMVISKVVYHKGLDGTYAMLEIMPTAGLTVQPNPITSGDIDIWQTLMDGGKSNTSGDTPPSTKAGQ